MSVYDRLAEALSERDAADDARYRAEGQLSALRRAVLDCRDDAELLAWARRLRTQAAFVEATTETEQRRAS